ncbi:[FeFe] hydrogenase H-cluster maturation GTPase HydF [Lachnospiraceae bacterium]|uniref:[FeFe] hydrogenase H-cluster maturation GTPase HydF n=1 Tax=Extibacter sp. GGCC_0201 TaxID=2731209 RepID=UPI001AA102D3|nr:[FeFe] hydrogenase H-cluster maturation GTPase HydF [Extibacter sp. GGCC_0201]MBO1722019.1 [FeFe] hydrogenase H-cluster maturation GTPase HydF [Extibacter sp. GGCC_0201]BDF35149.1 [FeFe] hydrogenase H-cluster maturation GTPase HydF [Lachnospiraceae bacterium]BDF39150.1 [FeFe] hydrogenase H-cluster maturation GTPase HydF [Lachnospiraceae bacterium]
MSLNSTPSSERIHIGIFGKRNAGKSSIINALTGQNLAIVSDVKGTTTDPVLKAMELLPLGPVVMIDTPGLDDEGDLGALRIQKAYQVLNKTDIAILVVDGTVGMTKEDHAILNRIKEKGIPSIVVLNKADIALPGQFTDAPSLGLAPEDYFMWVSASDMSNIFELKELIATLVPADDPKLRIVGDLIEPSDFIILVVPIDKAAPKGRLILPQQQTIRDILEADAAAIVIKENELSHTLSSLGKKPAMVITDSQVFGKVSKETPDDIPLTSFSILFARYKGSLRTVVDGARTLGTLEDGDTVLIAEGCTHHRQCDDIGTVKLPRLIQNYTGKNINFEFTSGTEFPIDLSTYKLVIHCGGCTLNEREMKYRLKCAEDARLPITNYGIAIAHMNGILERSIEIFPEL